MENLIQFTVAFISIVGFFGGIIWWWGFCDRKFDEGMDAFMAVIVPIAFLFSAVVALIT
jgi:hypothetical protein